MVYVATNSYWLAWFSVGSLRYSVHSNQCVVSCANCVHCDFRARGTRWEGLFLLSIIN